MRVLITGAWGIVGRETVQDFIKAGHQVRTMDIRTRRNLALSRRITRNMTPPERARLDTVWGSLTDLADVSRAIAGVQAVVHLGAIIPPLADQRPEQAAMVNVGGTELLIRLLERNNPACKLVFTSSIAIWGDRRAKPVIRVDDLPSPESHDVYAKQKLQAEKLVHESRLSWTILRLTYIVSADKLQMDPLLFEMPLDTPIEICHAADVALALRHAAEQPACGETFAIAGGQACRTTFAAYLHRMLELFGFGKRRSLPAAAWSTAGFHCGWMDTDESQKRLAYQRGDLEGYFRQVGRVSAGRRWLIALVRPLAWRWLLARSPYWQRAKRALLTAGRPASVGI